MFETQGFKVMKGLTDASMQRQEVLSNNLANIQTEGFVRQDIDFGSVLGELKSGIAPAEEGNNGTIARARYQDNTKMTLESEMSKLYDNHMRYLLLVKALGHHFEHMKKALEVRAS
jgi:flagellar basal body rod protein FlgB